MVIYQVVFFGCLKIKVLADEVVNRGSPFCLFPKLHKAYSAGVFEPGSDFKNVFSL